MTKTLLSLQQVEFTLVTLYISVSGLKKESAQVCICSLLARMLGGKNGLGNRLRKPWHGHRHTIIVQLYFINSANSLMTTGCKTYNYSI